MDGIDACLAEITGNGTDTKTNILDFETYPYHAATRSAILEACNPETGTVDKICRLNFYLGKLFADAAKSIANKARVPLADIDLIGSHGQTIYHVPDSPAKCPSPQHENEIGWQGSGERGKAWASGYRGRSTLQIGEPSVIAQETGVTTVADFRPRDIAAGGQGAPLVPYVDFILFRDRDKGRALQNIGGIANVTFLPPDCGIHDVIAFDTGPGNMIIDRITELITNNASHFDEGGRLAATGLVNKRLLDSLLAHPYLVKPPPKTTGREEFGRPYADNLYRDAVCSGIEGPDILATVTVFTTRTIADSYARWILPRHPISEIIISGGGTYNTTLMKFLVQYFPSSVTIHSISTFGIAPNAKEALAFAILANETISGNPNNIPGATGAKGAVIMGKIIP